MFSTIYFVVALLNDLFGSNEIISANKKSPLIRKIRDFFFSANVCSSSFAVTIYFWTIFTIDKNLIMSQETLKVIPPWYNHSVHSLISVVMLIEMIWTHHKFPSNNTLILWIGLYMTIYTSWIITLHHITGAWAYPFLGEFLLWQQTAFFTFSFIFGWSLNLSSKYLNSIIWRRRINVKNYKIHSKELKQKYVE